MERIFTLERLEAERRRPSDGATVLFTLPQPLEVKGGIGEHTLEVAKRLTKDGLTVYISSPVMAGVAPRDFGSNVLRIGTAWPFDWRGTRGLLPKYFTNPYKLGKILKDLNPDIIHLMNGHTSLVSMQIAEQAKLLKPKVKNINTNHGTETHNMYASILFGPFVGYFRWRKSIDAVTAVSESARKGSERLYPEHHDIIENGIDLESYTPEGSKVEKFLDGRPNVLFIGRLEPRKGIEFLIQAVPLIKQEYPNVRIIIAGTGRQDAELHQMAQQIDVKENVEFLGFISDQFKQKLLRTADVAVFPHTGNESFGIVIAEAMASGTPVVASNISGHKTLLKDGVTGLSFDPRNPQQIADQVITVLKNPIQEVRSLVDFLTENARNHVENYSWDKTTEGYRDVYDRVLLQPNRPMIPRLSLREYEEKYRLVRYVLKLEPSAVAQYLDRVLSQM